MTISELVRWSGMMRDGVTASHLAWYTVRASGYTALALLTVSVVIVVLLGIRLQSPRWPRFLTNELHAFTSLVSLVFIAIHIATTIADPYIGFGITGALVPFATGYRTWAMAAGIVATYLMVAVWLSSKLLRQIGWRRWRALHYSVFIVYMLAIVHTIWAGEDAGRLAPAVRSAARPAAEPARDAPMTSRPPAPSSRVRLPHGPAAGAASLVPARGRHARDNPCGWLLPGPVPHENPGPGQLGGYPLGRPRPGQVRNAYV